jgi:hypothetical protein
MSHLSHTNISPVGQKRALLEKKEKIVTMTIENGPFVDTIIVTMMIIHVVSN